ncbi:MAG: TonB-dependent receptor [Bacteroidota bacterium]
MNRIILSILTLLILPSALLSQNMTQTIRGTVRDRDSQKPLWGASVVVVQSQPLIGITTDSVGKFRLSKVPVGRHTLKISFIGYEDLVLPELMVGSGKEIVLNIELKESVKTFKEIKITANSEREKPLNSMSTVSARSFNTEETGRYAACINDPSRMAQSFAGVSGNGDQSNEIIIRGNSPRGMLWRMEGIEIPNPNHFTGGQGNSGGGVSILSNIMLSNSDFFTGAFPAEYGNALSGVFDINLRKGNAEKREYAFQFGVLGSEIALEGPLSKKNESSYLFSYRYSTLDFLYKIGLKVAGNIIPKFQDFSFNFNMPTKKIGRFSLFGIGGLCSLGNDPVYDSAKWKKFSDRFFYDETGKIGATGLSNFYLFRNGKTYLKTVLSLSSDETASDEDTVSKAYTNVHLNDNRFLYYYPRASIMLNHKFNTQHVIRTGILYSVYGYDLLSKSLVGEDGMYHSRIDTSGRTALTQAYVQWQYHPLENLTLNAGLHSMLFALNNTYSIEPRFGLRWEFSGTQTLTAGFGMHSRIESISNYLVAHRDTAGNIFYPNREVGFTRALHAVGGYERMLREDLQLKVELYYQYLYDVPVEDTASSFSALNYSGGLTDMTLVNKGTGNNYGIEITLEKFFTHNFYFLFTSSPYQSRYKGSDGVLRDSYYNGKYVLNLLGGKEWKTGKNKNNIIGCNLRAIYKGGNRQTPIDLSLSQSSGNTVYVNDQIYSLAGPLFFRTDVGFSYRHNGKKAAWILSFDAENAMNRKNVYSTYYDRDTKKIEYNYNLGLIPIIGFRVEF